ncbi:hypothetical protein C8R44DRAFT_384167 [Mycena epipterygia]|nr:hypothetical protein C8R44DRAFT_384167 [Mycena epipterygia]
MTITASSFITYWNEATAYPAMSDLMTSSWASGLDTATALSTSVTAASMDSTVQAVVQAQYAILADWAVSSNIGQVELLQYVRVRCSMIGIQFCLQHAFSRGGVHINSSSVFNLVRPRHHARRVQVRAPHHRNPDALIDSCIAKNSGTEYHPSGTNSMPPLAYGGVVIMKLVVYGAASLRVVLSGPT